MAAVPIETPPPRTAACRVAGGLGTPLAAPPEQRTGTAAAAASAARLKTWRERWCALRDRLLTSPDFQARAARTWWLRPIVRRRARGLFDLVAGFVYTQVLLACVRLNLFDILATAPASAAELAPRIDLPLDATERLLAAAAALELLEPRGSGRYGLGRLGAPMVGNAAVAAMIEHHASVLYADLHDPVALLRGGEPAAMSRYWAYAGTAAPGELAARDVGDYSALMSASQPLVAEQVLDAVSLKGHRCLLDVGGGEGRFLLAAARHAPALQLLLFDLPAVVAKANAAFAAAGLSHRAQVASGDFLRDALPHGADIASLIRVIYDHPDARAAAILRAVYDALPPGGTLLLAEPMAGAAGAARMGDAYFNFYLLAMRGGRARTAAELAKLVRSAGFEKVREIPTAIPLQVGVLVARKPLLPSPSKAPRDFPL